MQTAFQRWYAKNKTAFNAARKRRYHEDTEYRTKMLGYANSRRGEGRDPNKPVQMRDWFYISEVSDLIGRSAYIIRSWEKAGLIPANRDVRGYRTYTAQQVVLLKELCEALETHHFYGNNGALDSIVKSIAERWNHGRQAGQKEQA